MRFIFGLLLLPAVAVSSVFSTVANEYQLSAKLLYAMALTESGRTTQRGFRPWPWTLNIDGRAYRYNSRLEVYRALRDALLVRPTQYVDVGPMQISWNYHHKLLINPWTALEPTYNIRVGAYILADEIQRAGDVWTGVGHYHSPQRPALAQAYRKRVWLKLKPLL